MASVRLDHISKQFAATRALDDIDFTIASGEIFFLLGPSGCGKSTLLRTIAGLQDPTSGRVFFDDRDVTPLPTEQRNAVMCFQSYALWPHMTVEQNVKFGVELRSVNAAEQASRIAEVLRLVQLTDLKDRKPNQLSGGQQQRVALARALVVNPTCLLLDEPLSNLDAKLRLEMRTEIRRICRSANLTAIYVTHDQKEALSIADRMAVLNAGKIEQIGRPQDLYRHPGNKFVASFMGETNFLEGSVVASENGSLRVKTPLGEITAAAPSQPASGSVTLSIRPETIRIGPPPADAPNRFDGQLHDTIYLGEYAQHQLSPHPGGGASLPTLKAFETNPKLVARDQMREAAQFWFDPTDVVVLAR